MRLVLLKTCFGSIGETMKAVLFSRYDMRLVNLINENPIWLFIRICLDYYIQYDIATNRENN
jgi:hypothetical protein